MALYPPPHGKKDLEVPITLEIRVPADQDPAQFYGLLTNSHFLEMVKAGLPDGIELNRLEINDAISPVLRWR